jgi:hypothetical protein
MIAQKFNTTVDQVENTIKPYKFDVDCTDAEWRTASASACTSLETRIKSHNDEMRTIRAEVGRRRMRHAAAYLTSSAKDGGNGEAPFPIDILDKARTVASLTYQTQVMSMRLAAIKSRACRSSESRACCPEIYLHMLTDKLPPRPCLSMWSYWYFLNRTH